MSGVFDRLFDRLCDLAVADHVVASVSLTDSAVDETVGRELADLLIRAARTRQLDLVIEFDHGDAAVSRRVDPVSFDPVSIDPDDIAPAHLAATVSAEVTARLSAYANHGAPSFLAHARSGRISLGAVSSSLPDHGGDHPWDLRWLFATDRPADDDVVARLAERDLAIAVDCAVTHGAHQVTGVAGLLAVLDALVTLRSYAFGTSDGAGAAVSSAVA